MTVGVIPARLHSKRFPRKILAPVQEKPMIMHVYERAEKAQNLDQIIIAVDEKETVDVLSDFEVEVVMTAKSHSSGSDRVAEVIKDMEADIVVNIQGDEPLLDPDLIDELIDSFKDPSVEMATVVSTVISPEDFDNPNVVKVLLNERRNAILFRREVPEKIAAGCYRHVGIYAYRKATLLKFTELPPTENEQRFQLEQLRALDNGIPIRAVITDYPHYGIDTEEDLVKLKSEIGNN